MDHDFSFWKIPSRSLTALVTVGLSAFGWFRLCLRVFSRPSALRAPTSVRLLTGSFSSSSGWHNLRNPPSSHWLCSRPAAAFPAPQPSPRECPPPSLRYIPTSWTLCLHLCWFTSLFWWRLLSCIFLRKVDGGQCLLKWCMFENAYNVSYGFRISDWRSFPKLRRFFFFGFSFFFVLE